MASMESSVNIVAPRASVVVAYDDPWVSVFVPRGLLLRIEQPCGLSVQCDSGTLWITQLGMIDDYILTPGQIHALRSEGVVLVNPVRDSRYRLSHISGKAGTPQIDWHNRLIRWIRAR